MSVNFIKKNVPHALATGDTVSPNAWPRLMGTVTNPDAVCQHTGKPAVSVLWKGSAKATTHQVTGVHLVKRAPVGA